MPSTNIFGSGSSYSSTDFGGIDEQYHGNYVDITFKYFSTDKNGFKQGGTNIETKAMLKVMTLKQIKNEQIYKAELSENELAIYNYLHQWTIKHKKDQLIVYAGKDELGFMLMSESGDVIDDLQKLLSHHMCAALPFFSELKFDLLAKNHWGKSIDDLRRLPLMTPEKLDYFCHHVENIAKLVNHGASLEKLSAMQFDQFKKLVSLTYKLNQILTFVTMNQILGIDHIAPPVPKEEKNESNDNMHYIGGSGGGTSGDYTYEQSSHSVNISFKKKWTCKYESGSLKEEYVQQFNQIASEQREDKLFHRWIQIPVNGSGEKNEDNKVHRLYYSPDAKAIVKEQYDKDFPIDDLKRDHYYMLVYLPYFKELIEEKNLNNLGYSFEKLRALNGMTERKLEILTRRIFDTENLLQLGLKMEELAQVEENKLNYLMNHYSDVKEVAALVDIRELFGIGSLPSLSLGLNSNANYVPNFFELNASSRSSQINSDEHENRRSSICTVQ